MYLWNMSNMPSLNHQLPLHLLVTHHKLLSSSGKKTEDVETRRASRHPLCRQKIREVIKEVTQENRVHVPSLKTL